MCGLFGHIGNQDAAVECLKGLKHLEYRGYDSSGIAGLKGNTLFCIKEKGKLSALESLLEKNLYPCQSAIGHTRWATHGIASKRNAHPHLDHDGKIALVHNGILENHDYLRSYLHSKGVEFSSETDSEVIAQLIAYFDQGNLIHAVLKATELMEGSWGIALIHKNYPNQIIAFAKENPIVAGISKDHKEAFVSSDPYAFLGKELDLYFLKNEEFALITPEKITLFDSLGEKIVRNPDPLDLPNLVISKDDYPHFLLKEIHEQPSALRNTLKGRFSIEEADAHFDQVHLGEEELKSIDRVLILACGTSWHAGSIAALQLEKLAKIPSQAEIASEYRYKEGLANKKTLVIALSQSGETFDTLAAMRKAKSQGAKVVAICNVIGSTLMREADHFIPLRAGPEISVCSTKAFTCQLAILSLFTLKLGRLRGLPKKEREEILKEILYLPKAIELVLDQKEKIELLAKKYAHASHYIFLGRQYMYPTCEEAALKLKEITYLNAVAYPGGELKHGPIALIDDKCLTVGLLGNQSTLEKMMSNLMEVKAREGQILAFANKTMKGIEKITDDVIYLPMVLDLLSPLPYSVGCQLLAYYIALEQGTDIDQPRNLAKSVTVE